MARRSLKILVALPAVAFITALTLLQGPRPSQAAFHLAVIDEVLTSYAGDSDVQFVEIKMLATSQTVVANSVLAAFDTGGNYVADVLVVPSSLTLNTEVRWLMGTTQFETVSGLTPDFIMPAGLPSVGGMICWGAPGLVPPTPPNWDRTVFTNYIDCVAYGTYNGPSNIRIGTPTSLDADGHSLRRTGDTNDSAADFACADPADPTTHQSASASLPSTSPCPTPPTPTATPTSTPTPTPTPTKQPFGDTDGDGCTDTQENGLDETHGGRRDYLNFWDFFDPNRDRSVTLLDFLAILRHFGTVGDPSVVDPDGPEPSTGEYWALADRGGQAPGGDPWDELPANGSIGLADFLSVLRQFGHTCA